jgi:hypothetical protein
MIELLTIEDFSQDHDLYAHCTGCHRSKKLSWGLLGRQHGWQLEIKDLVRRLCCAECGHPESSISLVFNRCGHFAYGNHYTAIDKRQVQRDR